MNKHIFEFDKQARDYANEVYVAPVRSKTPDKIWEEGHITWDHIFQEKFAELIVWEAIGLCKVDVNALTGPFLPEYEKGIVEGYRRANENLRFYFAVEE